MIKASDFYDLLKHHDIDFFTGVPDSLLKSFCGFVAENVPTERHIIAANEGGAIGIALGYHMATDKIPLVYMQNSGLGNTVNPLLSLVDREVYSAPMLLLIGWRGQPGIKDEPQHVKQGRVMLDMLDAMEIEYVCIGNCLASAKLALKKAVDHVRLNSAPFALVVEKGAFADFDYTREQAKYEMTRAAAIDEIVKILPDDAIVVSTTGMASRELFENRASSAAGHHRDFLTVGGMGHASQIALGIALQQANRLVVCLDGDGALLMHMGSMAIIAGQKVNNYLHIVINNAAHGSVGGQPTVCGEIDLPSIARACGYRHVSHCQNTTSLEAELKTAIESSGPAFLEVKVCLGNKANLGRPTYTPRQNKELFKAFLAKQ